MGWEQQIIFTKKISHFQCWLIRLLNHIFHRLEPDSELSYTVQGGHKIFACLYFEFYFSFYVPGKNLWSHLKKHESVDDDDQHWFHWLVRLGFVLNWINSSWGELEQTKNYISTVGEPSPDIQHFRIIVTWKRKWWGWDSWKATKKRNKARFYKNK